MKKIVLVAVLTLTIAGVSTTAEAKSKSNHHKERNNGDYQVSIVAPQGTIAVTATAYNPQRRQTDSTPRVPSCGYKYYIRPGVRHIAASNDLWRGKKCGDVINIHGLGDYILADRMANRWHKKIDIVMESGFAARQWGKRIVHVRW
jgi:3D (Asp-Asp-Asp) domain-containing protein